MTTDDAEKIVEEFIHAELLAILGFAFGTIAAE